MIQTSQAHRLSLRYSREETATIKTFTFDTQHSGFTFKPGQYVRIRLESVVGDPRGNQREFSISSPSTVVSAYLTITTTIEPADSPFKSRLNSLRAGDTVTVAGPFGKFTLDDAADERENVMIAGGIGITPFRSIILTELAAGGTRRMKLIYSAKTRENLVFVEEFDELAKSNPNFSAHYTVTRPAEGERSLHTGRIDAQYIESLTNPANSRFLVAGPPAMVQDLYDQLTQRLGVTKENVRTEKFTGY